MRRGLVGFLWLLLVSQAHASVIFSDTFESFTDGDGCVELLAGVYTRCEETGTTSTVSIVTSIPGYASAMPSGTKVMRAYADSTVAQNDVGVTFGDLANAAYDNYIPAEHWFQFALYVNNYGAEVSVTTDRPAKLWYPMRGANGGGGCSTDTGGCTYILQGVRHNSQRPLDNTSLASAVNGDMFITAASGIPNTEASWAGMADGGTNEDAKLGQTSVAEWIKPNRWNIVRCHSNASNASAIALDCWIGAKGSALTHVFNWHGGDTVAGYAFTWSSVANPIGFRAITVPSTVPANNDTGTILYMYLDDVYVATTEGDLPNYANSTSSATGSARFVGSVRVQ